MQTNKEIVSSMETITSILLDNSIAYYIPEFQRDFVWGRDEIKQLFDDFCEDTSDFTTDTDGLEGYLLGNIVLIDTGKTKHVVDGQQRLTTLSLIAKAIYEVLNEHIQDAVAKNDNKKMQQWSKRIGEIERGFLILDDNDEAQGLKIQHAPSLKFGDYYEKLINNCSSDDDIESAGDVNIDAVYSYAFEYLNDLEDDQFQKFILYFKSKVKLIVTCAPTDAKAFQLFEILNDRGRSLEPMDLIKNSFLKTLTAEKKKASEISSFSDDWQEMIKNLQLDAKKKIPSSTFLKQYLIAFRGENRKADKLFDYFKDDKNGFDGNTIIEFVSNMNKCSKVYREIELGNYKAFLDDQNMFILFKLLGIKQFHPILMMVYGEDDTKKAKLLDTLTRLGAAVIFSYTQTNYIEKELPQLIKNYWEKKQKNGDKAFDNLIKELEKLVKDRAQIMRNVIPSRNFVGKNGDVHGKALLILEFVELYFNQNTKIITVPKGKKITVEHILSRKLDLSKIGYDKMGFVDENDKKENIHRIGNLTLLYNDENSSAGKKTFKEKEKIYLNSDFIMTTTIWKPVSTGIKNGKDTKRCRAINQFEKQYKGDKGQWTKKLIDKRSDDLADLLETIVMRKSDF